MGDADVDYEEVMDGTVVSVEGDAFVGDLVDGRHVDCGHALRVDGHEFSLSQVAEADRGKVVEGARFVWRRTADELLIEF